MNIELILREKIRQASKILFQQVPDEKLIQIQPTRNDFHGDYTIVVFPLLKISRKNPEETAKELGFQLEKDLQFVSGFNVVKGFLNLELNKEIWKDSFKEMYGQENFGIESSRKETIPYLVEFSSPNTNKPLHLGHIRNNLIGYSLAKVLEANGHQVVKTNIVNDRGIHICKSMLAWQKWGDKKTPGSTGKKGDHLVGDYYVKFDQELKKQIAGLEETGKSKEEAGKEAPLIQEAQQMLHDWEAGDPQVLELWKEMNSWVYKGFDETYKRLGVEFDKIYYESDTYKLGKELVEEALRKAILFRKEDGSVWADLSEEGLDEKLLLRADGTAVYMTQDLGTAVLRFEDNNGFEKLIYVVGNEQNYHFQVLKIIMKKLGYSWSDKLYHLSYGMVELPEGKMKSREGTVVDADDLMDEMIQTAKEMSEELGKLEDYSEEEKEGIYKKIGMGALKYFMLKVDPKKNMTFDPRESIDFNGNTGSFIQYTYARIQSVIRKAQELKISWDGLSEEINELLPKEKELVKILLNYKDVVTEAGENMSPALIANYCYELVKEYNQFYHDHSILRELDTDTRKFRLQLSEMSGRIIKSGMGLLGIEVPERM